MVAVSLDEKMVNVCVCIPISTPTLSGISQFFSGKKVTAPPSPKVPVRLCGRPKKKLFYHAPTVLTVRLGVVKQSFLGLPGQYGHRVTRANSVVSVTEQGTANAQMPRTVEAV